MVHHPSSNQPESTEPVDDSEPIQSGSPDGFILHCSEEDNDFLIDLINEVIDRLDGLTASVDRLSGKRSEDKDQRSSPGFATTLTTRELQLLASRKHTRPDCPGTWELRFLRTRTGKFLSARCTENCVFPQVIADDA
jgi:hypothetical protein